MSTAILISGQLRTFAQCYPTQRWHVLRHFADPHFFITVQFDQAEIIADLIKEYGKDRVHYDPRTDPDLTDYLTPELTAAYHLAPYANAAPAHQLLLQHWYQQQVWEHFVETKSSASRFDTIIRLRGDLLFHSFDEPRENDYFFIQPSRRARTFGAWSNVCFTPWWGRFGGVNDRFAIMGPEAAPHYFKVFGRIPEMIASGCSFHPESLVKASLESGNVILHETLPTEFSTLRLDGSIRPPEIAPWDIAHAALTRAA